MAKAWISPPSPTGGQYCTPIGGHYWAPLDSMTSTMKMRLQHPERLVVGSGGDLGEAYITRRPVQVKEVDEHAPR